MSSLYPNKSGGSGSVPSAGLVTSNGSSFSSIAAGTAGNVITDNGTAWVSAPPAGGSLNPATGPVTLYEEFNVYSYPSTPFGQLNTNMVGAYAKSAPTSTEQNRYGIAQVSDSSGSVCGFYCDTTPSYAGAATITGAMAFQIGANIPTNSANSWVATWGLGFSFPSQSNGAFFSMNYLSPNFQCITYNGSTTTTADSGVPYAANTWYNFRVVSTASSAKFYINGTLVQTITTNLPVGNFGNLYAGFTQQTGAGVVIRIDWAYVQFTPTSARGTF